MISHPMTWGDLKSWLEREGVKSDDLVGELHALPGQAIEVKFEYTPAGRSFLIRSALADGSPFVEFSDPK